MIDTSTTPSVQSFITRWKASGASERANYQLFLSELCELLGVVSENSYCFERPVAFHDGEGKTSTGFIDLYKRGQLVQQIDGLLQTLHALGLVRKTEEEEYVK